MKADHLSYRKATGVSLLGLTIQLVLGLVMLVYSVLWQDPAAFSAAPFILAGCIVWLSLAVVFDQHRRERLEALEAETMERSGVAGSSVFEAGAEELRVAARRLSWMHRVLLPTVSLLFATVLIVLGWWRVRHALRSLEILTVDTVPTKPGMQITLGIVIAIVGFIVARFVSGMSKQKVWTPLRAGAAQTVGAAVIGFAMVVAHFVDFAGSDFGIRYVHLFIPGLMVLIGIETILNFVLTIYRPRKAGEVPLPAFDSRILGFVAAPDKIAESIGEALNYQFGVNVTGSWFYQLLSRSLLMLVLIGGAVILAMTCFSVIRPNEQGLRIRNGNLVGTALKPGAVVKFPWPIERIERLDTASPHRLDLAGYPALEKSKSYLWTIKHHTEDKHYIVQPSSFISEAEQMQISAIAPEDQGAAVARAAAINDIMLVLVEIPVVFEITDLVKYYNLAQDDMRDRLLEAVGRRVVMRYLATQTLDDVLSARRTEISQELERLVSAEYARLDAGVKVLFVGIVGVHPPTRTATLFESVVGADQTKLALIEKAKEDEATILSKVVGSTELAQRITAELKTLQEIKDGTPAEVELQYQKLDDLLTTAQGEASIAISKAKSDRWTKHMSASGRSIRYKGQLAAYASGKNIYMAQLYFDALKDVLGAARTYIVPDQSVPVEIRMDLNDAEDNGNAFRKLTEDTP